MYPGGREKGFRPRGGGTLAHSVVTSTRRYFFAGGAGAAGGAGVSGIGEFVTGGAVVPPVVGAVVAGGVPAGDSGIAGAVPAGAGVGAG